MPDDTDFLWGLDLTARRGLHSIFWLLRELKFYDPGLGFKPFKPYPFLFAIKCLHSHEAIEYAIMDGRQAVESSFPPWEMGLFDEPETNDGSGGILWVGEPSELCGIKRRCALLVVQELAREIEGILCRITPHEVLREMRDAAEKCFPGGNDGTWRGVYWEDQERWNFFPHEEPRLIARAKSECRQLQQWEEKLRDEVKEHTSYWESERQLGLSADSIMQQLEKERNDALRVWSGRISRQTSLAAESRLLQSPASPKKKLTKTEQKVFAAFEGNPRTVTQIAIKIEMDKGQVSRACTSLCRKKCLMENPRGGYTPVVVEKIVNTINKK